MVDTGAALVVDTRPARGWTRVVLMTAALAVLLGGSWLGEPSPTEARARRPKAVIIVGPVGRLTGSFLASARKIAAQAQAEGMKVHRIFHPAATWGRVIRRIQGANLVVYVGHGNGWPSRYGPFQEDTKNGFGLNPRIGAPPGQVQYRGADDIRSSVRLARGAVVVLYRLCYAAGNGEAWQRPVLQRALAARRVDNFASGFLGAGAGVVFAFGTSQRTNIPRALMRTDRSMDGIFRMRGSRVPAAYDGFKGWRDYYERSRRMRSVRSHLDPHPRYGHLRAVTGRLRMTAKAWRRHAMRAADRPRVSRVEVVSGAPPGARSAIPSFSPDGDGRADRLHVRRRVSERGRLRVEIRDARGHHVHTITRRVRPGTGLTVWDGRARHGRRVPDGRYRLTLVLRDRSGKLSRPRHVDVRVLTTLRSYRSSRDAFHASDRDALAGHVRLRATLTATARVRWQVRDGAGHLVRTLLAKDRVRAGRLVRTWDGRDDRGRRVERGWYTVTLAARTKAGTQRAEQRVWVGAYRILTDRGTARRGARLGVIVRATEGQARAPRLEVRQPGIESYRVRTTRIGRDIYRAAFVPRRSGPPGILRIVIEGTDRAGGGERQTRSIPLR